MTATHPSLTVEKRPLLAALKSLRIGISARQKDEASVSFEAGRLVIEIQGNRAEVPAEGNWPGTVRIVARTLIPIVTFPPDPDPLTLQFKGDRFFIAGWSVNATWQKAGASTVEIPSGATYLEILALEDQRDPSGSDSSGLTRDFKNARQRMALLLAQAAKLLAPVGITEEDLDRLSERKLAEMRNPGKPGRPK